MASENATRMRSVMLVWCLMRCAVRTSAAQVAVVPCKPSMHDRSADRLSLGMLNPVLSSFSIIAVSK